MAISSRFAVSTAAIALILTAGCVTTGVTPGGASQAAETPASNTESVAIQSAAPAEAASASGDDTLVQVAAVPAAKDAPADLPGSLAPGAATVRTIPNLGAPILNAQARELYTQIFAAVEAGRWEAARTLLARGNDPVAQKLFRWLELQSPRSGATFEDIVQFAERNPDWPNQETLARRAEEALLDRRVDDSVVLAWYGTRNPLTPDGAQRFAEALLNQGQRERGVKAFRDYWTGGVFTEQQQQRWLQRFGQHLNADAHWARLDRLVWEGRTDEAKRMLRLVDANRRLIAETRMRLRAGGNTNRILERLPANLRNDPGLMYETMRNRRRNNDEAGARAILTSLPADLGRPEIWFPERAVLARRSIVAGRAREAFDAVRDHKLRVEHGANYVEAEFLAGWIALRQLNEPATAKPYFERLANAARTPVSRARGAYWMGRTLEAQKQPDAAKEWYGRAAQFHTAYYGQLAMARLDTLGTRVAWPAPIIPTAAERRAFDASELPRAVRILRETNENDRIRPLLIRMASVAKTPSEHALVSELAIQLGRSDWAVLAGKRSAQAAGVQLSDLGWPVVPLSGEKPERALTYAIIRQESQFESRVTSRAGARGLMQLMPATARAVAKSEGTLGTHTDARLFDPAYNIRLGRAFLHQMVEEFGGSYVLAAAAYNAGPGRAREWIRNSGDPREANVDAIDWIEMIPFEETRNYVQRIMENVQVYRRNLQGPQIAAAAHERDLKRARN
ncbi:MAG: murein transglycosylase [Tagaea sp. CACIAM 22H2]|nr:murein transglycosylase [Tagaea sp. CACIAM 22H2]